MVLFSDSLFKRSKDTLSSHQAWRYVSLILSNAWMGYCLGTYSVPLWEERWKIKSVSNWCVDVTTFSLVKPTVWTSYWKIRIQGLSTCQRALGLTLFGHQSTMLHGGILKPNCDVWQGFFSFKKNPIRCGQTFCTPVEASWVLARTYQ